MVNIDQPLPNAGMHASRIIAPPAAIIGGRESVMPTPNAGKHRVLIPTIFDLYRTSSLFPLPNAYDAGTGFTRTNWL